MNEDNVQYPSRIQRQHNPQESHQGLQYHHHHHQSLRPQYVLQSVQQQQQQQQQQRLPSYQLIHPQELVSSSHQQRHYPHLPEITFSPISPSFISTQSPLSSRSMNPHQTQSYRQSRDQQTPVPSSSSAREYTPSITSGSSGYLFLPRDSGNVISSSDEARERQLQQQKYLQHLQMLQQNPAGPRPIESPHRTPNQVDLNALSRPTPASLSSGEQSPVPSTVVRRNESISRSIKSTENNRGRSSPYPIRTRTQSNQPIASTLPTNTSRNQESRHGGELLRRQLTNVTPEPRPLPSQPVVMISEPETLPAAQTTEQDPIEQHLPPQAPISVQFPQGDRFSECEVDMTMMEEDDPIEVTLNVDIPKTSRPAAAGDPSVTVLSVNPSWHCVFVEMVQQQKIRTWIRVQFCPSPQSSTFKEHQRKIMRLRTLQVIGYASQQVELTRRISGQKLLEKGGITVHLDPSAISFNDASYGFTLSFSSFIAERLCRSNASRPDEPLPLSRQQNSAYCRRNLKELYYDTFSKDVVITLQPSGEIVHAHSVVLESHGYFRTLLGQATREAASNATEVNDNSSNTHSNIGGGSSSRSATGCGSTSNPQMMVDDEGYARPLDPQIAMRHQQQQQQQHQQQQQRSRQENSGTARSPRLKSMIEIQDINPNVFRAILHYMYIGHIPTEMNSLSTNDQHPQYRNQSDTNRRTDCPRSQQQNPSTIGSVSTTSTTILPSLPLISSPGSNTSSRPEPAATSSSTPSSSLATFSWRELYEIANRFQLSGLMHLSKLVLISRLDSDNAVNELFEWAYLHWNLVPCYVSFLIENMGPDLLGLDKKSDDDKTTTVAATITTATNTSVLNKSVLWHYHNKCPRFNDIMAVFLKILNERKQVPTLV